MNAFKLCEPMGSTHEHQKFIENVVIAFLKVGEYSESGIWTRNQWE